MSAIAKMKELRRRFEKIPVDKIVGYALLPEMSEIERLNRKQMEAFGIDSTGSSIEPEYKRTTVRIKKAKGQESDFVTLKDSGDFHGSIRAKLFKNKVRITSSDGKAPMLFQKYGESVLGLAPFNIKFIAQKIRPKVARLTIKHLKGE